MLNYPTYGITPANGSLDTSFDQGSGFIVGVSGISKVKESGGSLFVGGIFTVYDGTPVGNIARIFI